MTNWRQLRDPATWYAKVWRHKPLYPDQLELCVNFERALDLCSSAKATSLKFANVASRQSGKNHSICTLCHRLLVKHSHREWHFIQFEPSFKPQCNMAMERTKSTLDDSPITKDKWETQEGYQLRYNRAVATFMSTDIKAKKRGLTAHCMVFDEAQEIDETIANAQCMPMAATSNAPVLCTGTRNGPVNFLESMLAQAEEQQKTSGIKQVYITPWWVRAEHNPLYAMFVEGERNRLGHDHPLFKMEYCCEVVDGIGMLFSHADLELMRGNFQRCRFPHTGREVIVGGLDICGAVEECSENALKPGNRPKRDSLVATVASLKFQRQLDGRYLPVMQILDHFQSEGKHPSIMDAEVDHFLFGKWRCVHVAVDEGGVGQMLAKILSARYGSNMVTCVPPSVPKWSEIGFALIGAVKTNRLKHYSGTDDESTEFWKQCSACRREIKPNGMMKFESPHERIHDDYCKALALTVHAAETHVATMGRSAPVVSHHEEDWGSHLS